MSRASERAKAIIDRTEARGAITAARAASYREQAERDEPIDWDVLDSLAAPQETITASGQPLSLPVNAAGQPVHAGRMFERSPAVEELRASHPALVASAEADNPNPPQLFGDLGGGAIPPITASGIQPAALLNYDWRARRPMAAAKTSAEAYEIAEKASDPVGLAELAQHPANRPYLADVATWAKGEPSGDPSYADNGQPDAVSAADSSLTERLHAELFGPHGVRGHDSPARPGRPVRSS